MSRPLAVQLAPGVWRVPLVRDYVNGFILRDPDGQVTMLDMGLARSGPRVMAALGSIGSAASDVTRLLLTHAHPDHAGGAAHVAEQTGRGFGIHAGDAASARAGQPPPGDSGSRIGRLFDRYAQGNFPAVPVEEELHDGQVLPLSGGLQVVHTPGHSPGHAAFLHLDSGVLITGDSIFNVAGLRWPLRWLCTDFTMTKRTAHRLTELDYTVAAFTHGPEIRDRPRELIRRFLQEHGTPAQD